MRATFLQPPLRLSLTWLVWLALLLPVAQSAASWHRYSHPATANQGVGNPEDGKQTAHNAHCDLCLAAAVVAGGALPGVPPGFDLLSLRHEKALTTQIDSRPARTLRAYRSRAPPALS